MRLHSIVAGMVLLMTVGRAWQTPPEFEVAAIKPSTAESGPTGIKRTPGQFITSNTSLAFLVRWAYSLDEGRVIGATRAMDSTTFDIVAKIPAGELLRGQLQLMMQALLADRFHLRVHKETRELPSYTLVVDKDGPKIHFVELGEGIGQNPFRMPGRGHLVGTKVTTDMLAKVLSDQIGRPVENVTGLDRPFDFDLAWSPESDAAAGAESQSLDGLNRLPSLFAAVRQQLGLRLVAHKSPVEVIVIDSVNTSPTEN